VIVRAGERFVRAADLPPTAPGSQSPGMQHPLSLRRALAAATLVTACGGAHPEAAAPAPRTALEAQHVAAVRSYFDDVWSAGKLELLDRLLAPDYINHTPSTPDPVPGPAGLRPIVAAFRVGFPDLHFTIEDLVAEGDRVAVRVTMEGTQDGPLFGAPPTHRHVRVSQINIEHFRGDQIAEHWRVTDELGVMRQLGALP
jgi:steroid delta-isomerase-like uncharacterized protein